MGYEQEKSVTISEEAEIDDLFDLPKVSFEKFRKESILCSIEVVDANTLLSTEYKEPRYIWYGILPDAGICVCAASKSMGKTQLLLQLADAISKGEPFLGVPTEKSKVLFVELELSKKRIAQRLLKMRITPNPDLMFSFKWKPGEEGLEHLEVYIEENHIQIVIVDVLQMLWPVGSDSNNYQETYSVLAPFRQMAYRQGCMLIFVTHRRKAESTDHLDSIIGSTGISANADVLLTISRVRGQASAILIVDGNDVESQKIPMEFHADPLGYVLSDQKTSEIQLTPERRSVLEILNELGGEATTHEVAEKYGKTDSTVSGILKKLQQDGFLRNSSYGKYSIVQTESAVSTESGSISET